MTIETHNLFTGDLAEEALPSGRLCLEFANTADWHASSFPQERISTYADLVQWACGIGLLDAEQAAALTNQAQTKPKAAHAIHAEAIALREAIYHLFSAIAAGRTVPNADLALLTHRLPAALAQVAILPPDQSSTAFRLHWQSNPHSLDYFLSPVIRSAAGLLIGGELDRVRECADDRGCGYLFYDTTRNRSRRWCDMNSCGNRAKARRHYARHSANLHDADGHDAEDS